MTQISSLTALTGAGVDAAADLVPIVDMSLAGSARNKKILVSELKLSFNLGTAADLDIDIDDTLAADSDSLIPTQQAVKAYVDAVAGGGGVDVEDEGTPESTGATTLNFVGSGVTAADMGGGVTDITIPGATSGIDIEDEGVAEASGALILNFAGAGVTAADVGGGQVDITIPGSSAALLAIYEDQKAANTAGGTSTSGSWIVRTLNAEVHDDIGITLSSNQLSLPSAGVYIVEAEAPFFKSNRVRTRIQDVTTRTITVTIASPGVVTLIAHGLAAGTPFNFHNSGGALPTGITAGTVTYYVLAPAADTFTFSLTPGGAAVDTSGSQSGTHTITVTLVRSVNGYSSSADNVAVTSWLKGIFTLAGAATIELQYRVESGAATNGLGPESNFATLEIYSRLKLTKLS